jgi:S-DNA-T family DNA segregation ATPase FtsK/SpoIIIE
MADKIKNTPTPPAKKAKGRRNTERRKQITVVLLMVAGVLSLLAILSYAGSDEAVLDKLSFVDVFRLPFDDAVKGYAADIQNRLGLVGALVADAFVNGTFGYTAAFLPCLAVMWGWIFLTKREKGKPLTFTNYALIGMLLLSTTFGVANRVVGDIDKEWSGCVGAFSADILTRLLGSVGASIVVLTALFITVVLAIDLDIHKSLERASHLWAQFMEWVERRRNRVTIAPTGEEDEIQPPSLQDEEDEVPTRMPEVIVRSREEPEEEYTPADGEDPADLDEDVPAPAPRSPKPAAAARPAKAQDAESAPAPADEAVEEIDYVFPSVELLDAPRQSDNVDDEELKANAELVRTKLARFGVEIESVSVMPGPVITLYELVPASGVKISRIVSLADDLALALAARGIRIMAPIPGKSAVGVEIPNKNPSMVFIRSILNSTKFRESKAALPVALGKNISGEALIDDLAKMPHLLIAGATGSGKSVGINTLLAGLLYRLHPSDVKFIIIDPKKIELTQYAKLKHHFLAVSPDIDEEIITTPENAVSVLKSVELEMEKRYDRLAAAGVRNISDYNERLKTGRLKNSETIVHRKMPYLVVASTNWPTS